ncbi:MAG: N-acetylmuramic acid 6-phosphate etherase [Candidatus Kapaibacteriota bacterium]
MTSLFKEISNLATEQRNQRSSDIDLMSTMEILELINSEDAMVAHAIKDELPSIEKAVDIITEQFKLGGRLFYVGAGTSGRLGIVDASECPPTFGTNPEMVQGIIAGGDQAMFKAQEGAEDSIEYGAQALIDNRVNDNDVICGIAASGRTPFVRGALDKATDLGCHTILVTTNSRDQLSSLGVHAEIVIAPNVGPEVIAGSTRMKSGTAQKMVLNMLTTASMIRLGKSYGNIMVDLQLTNAKLRERAKRIIMEIADVNYDKASEILDLSNGHVKTALVMLLADVDAKTAGERLQNADGFIKHAL